MRQACSRFSCCILAVICAACSATSKNEAKLAEQKKDVPAAYVRVDPATAGTIAGKVHFAGKRPARKLIDRSGDPACVEAHPGKVYAESIAVNSNGTVGNVFVYVKSGLQGNFAAPATPVTIDQKGCWFEPHVMGIQTGQALRATNSDPVTHNIHPLAEINREWNHSQGAGDAPLARKFTKPEVMIRVKCNIHSWMRSYIGVLDHPYFAVTGKDGSFAIPNLPPGEYIVSAWQETLGSQDQKITVTPAGKMEVDFRFDFHIKGE